MKRVRFRWLVRAASWLVPRNRRAEWLAEWDGELWALESQRGSSLDALGFVSGAWPHALAELRAAWTLELLWHESRQAARALLRTPLFLLVAVLLLSLGIGANSTIFALINATLLREPPGVSAPAELVQIGRGDTPREFDNYSHPVWQELRAANDVFTDIAAYSTRPLYLGRSDNSRLVEAELVSANYFALLGVPLVLGRAILPAEEAAGRVVVLGHDLWQREFAGDRSVLGRSIQLQGVTFQVVGVAAAGFRGARIAGLPADVWLPLGAEAETLGGFARLHDARLSWLWLVGRLRPEVSHAAAQQRLRQLHERLEQQRVFATHTGIQFVPGLGLRPAERAEALAITALLSACVVLVLLIACLNLAGLLLVRGARRSAEIGIRLALGATRLRMTRQLLVETMLLALLSAVAAYAVSFWSTRWLEGVVPWDLAVNFRPDARVLLFSLAAALATAMTFGLWPAWRASAHRLAPVLRAGAAAVVPGGARLRTALVGLQVGLSFVLLFATGLLLESLLRAQRVDPGFRTRAVVTASVLQPATESEQGQQVAQALRIERSLQQLPGVLGAALSRSLPLSENQPSRSMWPGEAEPSGRPASVPYNVVSADYFAVLDIAIVRGRTFDDRVAAAGSEPVAIISRALAERFWPGEDALGRVIGAGSIDGPLRWRVIGIAEDVATRSLREQSGPYLYLPISQQGGTRWQVHLYHAAARRPAAAAIVAAIRKAAPHVIAGGVTPLDERVRASLGEARLLALLSTIFGALALLLATVGLYGVVAQAAAQRQREFGLRLALGAAPSGVAALVLRHAARLVGFGLCLGAPASLASSTLLRDRLFGVSPAAPHLFLAGALVVSLTAALAALLPALRALRTDPIRSLQDS